MKVIFNKGIPMKQKVKWQSIDLCPNGHIQLRFGPTSIHLSYPDWTDFLIQVRAFIKNCEENPRVLEPVQSQVSSWAH